MDQKSNEARLAKMLTAISLQECTESASVERRFVPMADGRVCWCELAFLLTAERKHPPDIDHHREIRGSGGRVRRTPRADNAVAFALQTSLGIVRPLRVTTGRRTSASKAAMHNRNLTC
jgi:hypothetical protein